MPNMKKSELRNLIREIIDEGFDFSEKSAYPVENKNRVSYYARVFDHMGHSHDMNIDFQNFRHISSSDRGKYLHPDYTESSNAYNAAYNIDGSQTQAFPTTGKQFSRIFATFLFALKDFIIKNTPDYVYFKPTGKKHPDEDIEQKGKIYRNVVPTIIKDLPNYNIQDYQSGFFIFKR